MTRTPKAGVALLFVATVGVVPLGLVVSKTFSEPYPALFNPAFQGAQEDDGLTTITQPSAVLLLADGGRRTIDYTDLFPETPLRASTLLSNAFGSQAEADDEASQRWLAERVALRFPELAAEGVELTWRRVTYVIATQDEVSSTLDRQVVVDLGGEP